MTDIAADTPAYTPQPAPIVRLFGWVTLALMFAFLLNNVLTWWFGWTGVEPLYEGQIGWQAVVQLAIYIAAIAWAAMFARNRGDMPLREDAAMVTGWNTFFIRAAFWVVFLVGLVDMAISALRVEDMLPILFGDEMASNLGRSQYRGFYIHGPVVLLGILFACVSRTLGLTPWTW